MARWTAEQQRRTRERLRAAGLCEQCCRNPRHPNSLSMCEDCVIRHRLITRQLQKSKRRSDAGSGRLPILRPEI